MASTHTIAVGSDIWKARLYAGLSVTSELADRLNRPAVSVSSLFLAWRIYRSLAWLNRRLEEVLSEYDSPKPFLPAIPSETILVGRDILLQLYADCNRLRFVPEGTPLRGLINRRLALLKEQSERILDVADWFDAMSRPEETDAKFRSALADMDQGNVVPWTLAG